MHNEKEPKKLNAVELEKKGDSPESPADLSLLKSIAPSARMGGPGHRVAPFIRAHP